MSLGIVGAPRSGCQPSLAIASISTRAPFGRAATPTVDPKAPPFFRDVMMLDHKRLLRRAKSQDVLGQASAGSEETSSRCLRRGGGILRGSF